MMHKFVNNDTIENEKVNNQKDTVSHSKNLSANDATNHYALISYLRANSNVNMKKFRRNLNIKSYKSHNDIIYASDVFLSSSLRLSPEAVGFLFHVDGCSKNLLLYLLLHGVDFRRQIKVTETKKTNSKANNEKTLINNSESSNNDTIEKTKMKVDRYNENQCRYLFNPLVIKQFIEYSKGIFGKEYKVDTVKQAHRDLVEMNITLNISRGEYFLNPLMIAFTNDADKRKFANEYSKQLKLKKKDTFMDYYPIYLKA